MPEDENDKEKRSGSPGEKRIQSRASTLKNDQAGLDVDDHVAQAEALLDESDARKDDPSTTELDDDSVERRTSDEATPPPEEV